MLVASKPAARNSSIAAPITAARLRSVRRRVGSLVLIIKFYTGQFTFLGNKLHSTVYFLFRGCSHDIVHRFYSPRLGADGCAPRAGSVRYVASARRRALS